MACPVRRRKTLAMALSVAVHWAAIMMVVLLLDIGAAEPPAATELSRPAATELEQQNAALRRLVKAQGHEITAMRAGGAATKRRRGRHLSLPTASHLTEGSAANNVDAELQGLIDVAGRALPGRRRLQTEHVQLQDNSCSNDGEVGEAPQYVGNMLCGHVMSNTWGSIDHTCHSYFCGADENGTNLCSGAHLCDAMCGFCARESEAVLQLGHNSSVEVTATDFSNDPHYHSLSAEAGRVYRIRAFPDLESQPAVLSMLLVIRNPSGKPIRRAMSNTGTPLRDNTAWVNRTLTELEAEARDVELGCVGNTHLDIVFKATQDGIYSIGLAQATDSAYSRPDNMTVHEFTMQWRGERHPYDDEDHPLIDLGVAGAISLFGPPANGTLTLLADDITASLAPLPEHERIAMEELRSVDYGVGIPEYVWDPNDHPCTWGGDHVGLDPSCCLRDDAEGHIQASISSVDLNMWWHVHRGAHDTSDFIGTIPNSIVNLSSLRHLHVGPSQISGTIPPGLATLPLHRMAIDNTQNWGEIPAVSTTMQFYVLRSASYLSGTVPSNLGAVDSLRVLWFSGMERLSGTYPSLCGHQSTGLVLARNNPRISGTIHDLPHEDHGSYSYDPDRCFISEAMGNLGWSHTKLSGTISEKWACSQGGTASLTAAGNNYMWNTELSGTLPACMFDNMRRLSTLWYANNKFTGAIPNLNLSTLLHSVRFEGNDFEQFPSSFPPELRMFKANDNPKMLATGTEVADLLKTAPKLYDFSVSVDNTLASMQLRSGGGIGPLPDIGWSDMRPTLPLDCRFGQDCGFSLELVVGGTGDYVPLRSVGVDFEVHLSNSPVDLNDQIIGIGHLISNSLEHWSGNFNEAEAGRRRMQTAHDSAAEMPAVEEIEQAEMENLFTGKVGHFGSHLASLNLTRTIIMEDPDDGTVNVVIPADWFHQSGRYPFRIFGTTNYCAVNDSGTMITLPPGSCDSDDRCDCSAHERQLLEFYDKSLWFINMHPIICHDPRATPNAAGTTCQCSPGSAPNDPCEAGDSYCECVRCSEFGKTSYSDNGVECKQCGIREVSNSDATGCQCGDQWYNSSKGLITCHDQDVITGTFEHNDAYKVARDQRGISECIECPSCVDCTVMNDPPRIRAGFHLSDEQIESQLWLRGSAQEKCVIRCRPESLEDDEIKDERLKALSEGTLASSILSGSVKSWSVTNDLREYPDDEAQCLGTPIVNGTMLELACAYGHQGTACGECMAGFGKKNENQCIECEAALQFDSIMTVLATAIGLSVILGVVMIGLSFWIGDVYGEHLGKFRGHVSDLDSDLSMALRNKNSSSNPLHESDDGDAEIDVHLRTVFERVDSNHSGHIDRDELAEMARSLGHYMTKPELDASMALMDPNGDGLVSFDEFVGWIKDRDAGDGGGLFPVVSVSMSTLFRTSQNLFFSVAGMSIQPLKLFISYWQIAAQLGPVLHFSFPPQMAALIKIFKPLIAAIHGFVALECAGLTGGFYVAWLVEVFVIPALLWGCVGVYYLVRRRTLGPKEANAKSSDDALFVLFCVYPMISNKLFKMLNCRDLGTQRVVASDYSVDCDDSQHKYYEGVAIIMIVLFSFGVPLGIMTLMMATHKQRKKDYDTPEWNYIARRVATQLAHDNVKEIKAALIDISLGTTYGPLVNAYRPGHFRWESFDMIRKLLLVGMLTLVQQGSVLQICAGLATSFVFFAAHVRALPFRHMEDNVLKATTEAHLFTILVLVLTLKSGLENEVLDEEFYDTACTVLFVIFVPLAFIICIAHKWHTVVAHGVDATSHNTHTQYLQAAFQRHRLGRDKAEDRLLLAEYLAKLEDEVKSDYHVFISYRVATEAAFAKQLYEKLSEMTLAETGQKLRVYLDQERLEDGLRWDRYACAHVAPCMSVHYLPRTVS
eukprot:COSAG06_NODE_2819_length_6234_cov_2.814996_1_plen_1898_part_00